jgi:hypothetical protein
VKPSLLVLLGAVVAAAPRPAGPPEPALHVRHDFTLTVPAPYARTFPLFGADRERVWSPGWAPVFVYPDPAADTAGMVFTVSHEHLRSVWVNTAFDAGTGHVQYVSVIAGALVTVIDMHVRALDAGHTGVTVSYERTALAPEAAEHVRALGDRDAASGPAWQEALSRYVNAR